MRFNLKRVFLLSFIAFCTTLFVLSWPKQSIVEKENDGAPFSRYAEKPRRRFLAQKISGVGEQLPFQKQPNPPSLISNSDAVDPFDFSSRVSKQLLNRLSGFIRELDLQKMAAEECVNNTTLADYWLITENKQVPTEDSWERFYAQIGSCDMYRDEKMLSDLLHDLNTVPIKNVHIMDGGTQVKLVFTFQNGKQAVFKPMRFGREYESDPNHFYFSDFERHHAEIATFHLDKILGFRRAVPTVGRIVNITSELMEKAEKKLKKTFFISPAKNHCFVSRCDYYCDTTHAICGLPDLKEGSVQVFLPDESAVPRKHNRSPYRRTYSKKNQIAEWQSDMEYCTEKVKTKKQYAHGRRLLDLIDLHIMDFLIGNQDRHHYESLNVFERIPSYAIHLDNGRAFGRSDFDDIDILLPLRQCCVIRPSTLSKLIEFYRSPKLLTRTLHESLSKDPVNPILSSKHYPAMERRLGKIMEYLVECFESRPAADIVVAVYHNPGITQNHQEEESEKSEETEQDKKA